MKYRISSQGYFGFDLRAGTALAVALVLVTLASPGRVLAASDRFKATIADGGAERRANANTVGVRARSD